MTDASMSPASQTSSGNVPPAPDIATRAETRPAGRTAAFVAAALAAPVAIGLGTAALTRRTRDGAIAGGVAALAAAALRWQLQRWFTDEPAYEVERRIGRLEIRRYAPRVEARTFVGEGSFDRDLDAGFRRLAKYIFGGNTSRKATTEELAMTTPVTATAVESPRTIGFVMPPGRTRASLPRPNDPLVEVVDVPAQRIAVVRFRGRYTGKRVRAAIRRLDELIENAGLVARGEPTFAGFDPPTTLGLLRRNEIWVELL